MSTFNLLEEPFLLVQRRDGGAECLSLREIFNLSQQVDSLGGELPTQSFAHLRLLVAILYHALEPKNRADWRALWKDGLPLDTIDAYLTRFEDRFELFHPERPFFQVAGLRKASGEVLGLEKLICDVPNGHPYFTTRLGRGLERISAAEGARWLIHAHAFDSSGIKSGAVGDPQQKQGKGTGIGTGWPGQLGGIVLHGNNLQETLLLNLVPLNGLEQAEADDPRWASVEPATPVRRDFTGLEPPGVVSLLTWQSRRIRLDGDADGITGVLICQGDKMTPQNRQRIEPMSAWRFSEPQTKKNKGLPTYMPRKHDPDRALWRNLPEMVETTSTTKDGYPQFWEPETMISLRAMSRYVGGNHRITIQVVGLEYENQETTVADMISDSLGLSVSLLDKEAAPVRGAINTGVAAAEASVRTLGQLAGNLARASGERGNDARNGPRLRAMGEAYAAIDQSCRIWISGLSADSDPRTEQQAWQRHLRSRMIRAISHHQAGDSCAPRRRGDDPSDTAEMSRDDRCSPQTRG